MADYSLFHMTVLHVDKYTFPANVPLSTQRERERERERERDQTGAKAKGEPKSSLMTSFQRIGSFFGISDNAYSQRAQCTDVYIGSLLH